MHFVVHWSIALIWVNPLLVDTLRILACADIGPRHIKGEEFVADYIVCETQFQATYCDLVAPWSVIYFCE